MSRPADDLGTGGDTSTRYRRADCGPGGLYLAWVINGLQPEERIVSVYPISVKKGVWSGADMSVALEALIEKVTTP